MKIKEFLFFFIMLKICNWIFYADVWLFYCCFPSHERMVIVPSQMKWIPRDENSGVYFWFCFSTVLFDIRVSAFKAGYRLLFTFFLFSSLDLCSFYKVLAFFLCLSSPQMWLHWSEMIFDIFFNVWSLFNLTCCHQKNVKMLVESFVCFASLFSTSLWTILFLTVLCK